MECVWAEVQEESDCIKATRRIRLMPSAEGSQVLFGKSTEPKGCWKYLEEQKLMILEFAAKGIPNVPWRRHALLAVTGRNHGWL